MKKKILGFVVIAMLMTVSVTVFILANKQAQTANKTAFHQQATIMSFATAAIQVGLSNNLTEYIQSTLQQIQINASFHAAMVYDEDMIPLLTLPQEYELPKDLEQSLFGVLAETVSREVASHVSSTNGLQDSLKVPGTQSNKSEGEASLSRDSIVYRLSLIEDEDGQVIGYLLLSFDNTVIQNQTKTALIYAFKVSLAVAAPIILFIAWQLSRMINPIISTTKNMIRLAEGNTNIELRGLDRRDEIGSMVKALRIFRDRLIEKKEFAAKLASAFEDHVGGVLKTFSSSVSDLESTSTLLSAVAKEGSGQAANMSEASGKVSSSIHSVATAAEQLSCSINEITQQIEQSKTLASRSVKEADAANGRIVELTNSHKEVDDILGFINDVSAQTKLLALNASIEAARAGEAGKGFSVVANEVKNLSIKTEDATSQISQKMGDIQEKLRTTTAVIEGVSKTIHQINEISEIIYTATNHNNIATREISQNAQVAAQCTQETMGSLSNVSAASEKTGHAAESMDQAIRTLAEQSNTLRTEIDKFLSSCTF